MSCHGYFLLILCIAVILVAADRERDRDRKRCPKKPEIPKGCVRTKEIYKRRCLISYECLEWNNSTSKACAGAPTCPPPPSHDCVTNHLKRTINGTRCDWGCKHWCCGNEADLLKTCPEIKSPYCVATNIVRYTINGRECPVYCGCIPDCTKLTC